MEDLQSSTNDIVFQCQNTYNINQGLINFHSKNVSAGCFFELHNFFVENVPSTYHGSLYEFIMRILYSLQHAQSRANANVDNAKHLLLLNKINTSIEIIPTPRYNARVTFLPTQSPRRVILNFVQKVQLSMMAATLPS